MDNGKYIGGISPAFDAITTESELAVKFMNKLFKNQPDVDEKVKNYCLHHFYDFTQISKIYWKKSLFNALKINANTSLLIGSNKHELIVE